MKYLQMLFILLLPGLAFSQQKKPVSISVFTHAWTITFYPDGHARACYGSGAEDCTSLAEGTVDFNSLLSTFSHRNRNAKVDTRRDWYQIAIHKQGQTEASSFSIKDESVIDDLLSRIDGKWSNVGSRLEELKRRSPMIAKRDKN